MRQSLNKAQGTCPSIGNNLKNRFRSIMDAEKACGLYENENQRGETLKKGVPVVNNRPEN